MSEMWTQFVPVLLQWLKEQMSAKGHRQEAAIRALQTAVLETNLYETALGRGDQRNLERQRELMGLWGAAAASFYRFDPDLTERLQLKAEYRTDPESWTRENLRGARISLQEITELTRQLLREG